MFPERGEVGLEEGFFRFELERERKKGKARISGPFLTGWEKEEREKQRNGKGEGSETTRRKLTSRIWILSSSFLASQASCSSRSTSSAAVFCSSSLVSCSERRTAGSYGAKRKGKRTKESASRDRSFVSSRLPSLPPSIQFTPTSRESWRVLVRT